MFRNYDSLQRFRVVFLHLMDMILASRACRERLLATLTSIMEVIDGVLDSWIARKKWGMPIHTDKAQGTIGFNGCIAITT
jgi:hypothetical protein